MDRSVDPRGVFSTLQKHVTSDLLHLMDGLYCNIEAALFELAFRGDDESRQRHCFDLMREMRYRRSKLAHAFARRLQREACGWFGTPSSNSKARTEVELRQAMKLSSKCATHFTHLLQCIAQRAAMGTGHALSPEELPISPMRIADCFLLSCRALEFDKDSIATLEDLFQRFILDRLGPIYGQCNQHLQRSGFLTRDEMAKACNG